MKKTYNINIGGSAYVIDDDAYTLLNDYLSTLEHAFCHVEDYRELVSDIEVRIAEHFNELTYTGQTVINLKNVEDVIAMMGKPEDILDIESEEKVKTDTSGEETVEEEVKAREKVVPPPYFPKPKINKRFFRDPNNAMIGGVCAGIAAYLNIDVTLVRILMVVFAFLSLSTVAVAYIVLWIILPPAVTPYERMQMTGEDPTISAIGQTVTETFKETREPRSAAEAPATTNNRNHFGSVVLTILVVLAIVILCPIVLSLAIGAIGCLFALMMGGGSFFGLMIPAVPGMDDAVIRMSLLLGIAVILAILIPLLWLVLKLTAYKGRKAPRGLKVTMLVIWIISFCAIPFLIGYVCANDSNIEDSVTRIVERHGLNNDADWDDETSKTVIIQGPGGTQILHENIDTANDTIVIGNDSVK